MKRALLTGAALLLAASTVAYAQNNPAVPGFPDVKVLPVDTTPAPAKDGIAIRQQLAANLSKAGFTDVKIVPEAFLVQAKSKSGNPVMMFISPDSMTVFTAEDAKGKDARTAADATPSSTPKQ